MSYLFHIFRRHSWDVSTLVQNNFIFLVCLSVCSLPHFLTENRLSVLTPVLDEVSFLNFLEIFLGFFTLLQNNFRFLVCLLVCSLPHFITENRLSMIAPVLDELAFSNFLETFLGCRCISSK